MNFLAHAYLSFNQPEILVGNLISDFVKGKKKFDYLPGIQKGMALHRDIDSFTDAHDITKLAKEIFKPYYRLYAGAFVDVVYDHFLAIDENEFNKESLLKFSQEVYVQIAPFLSQLPEKFQIIFPYMKEQNWLNNYQYKKGIKLSMEGVVKRSKYLNDANTAFDLFENNFMYLQQCYNNFFPLLKNYAFHQWRQE